MEISQAELAFFLTCTLGGTALWVYALKHKSFQFLALAMFFPTIFAVLTLLIFNSSLVDFIQVVLFGTGSYSLLKSVVCSIFGILVNLVVISACCFLALFLKFARRPKSPKHAIHAHNRDLLVGFARAAGEEIGWRSFMIPGLLQHFSPFMAFLISGLVWGLYHLPIMILQKTKKPSMDSKFVLCQFLAMVTSSFLYGYLAMWSGFSMWAPSLMHFTWNQINPLVLGSIYTNQNGKIEGAQWLINGEGLLGSLVTIPIIFMFHKFS